MEPVTKKFNTDYEEFNSTVELLINRAKKEIAGEGLPLDQVVFRLELDMLYGGQVHRKRSMSPVIFVRSQDDMAAIYKNFEKEFSETFSPLVVHPEGGVFVESFVLVAAIPAMKLELPKYAPDGPDPAHARKGSRECYWGDGKYSQTEVLDFGLLKPGNRILGPAILEAEYTTAVIPQGFVCNIDEHLFGRIERI
jgi:N-methylhydantoinase A/acetophenone carboxylase